MKRNDQQLATIYRIYDHMFQLLMMVMCIMRATKATTATRSMHGRRQNMSNQGQTLVNLQLQMTC